MKWTTASMDSKDDQARTRNIEMNEFIVRGGKFSYKSIKPITSVTWIATVFCLYFSDPFLVEGPLHYIAPFGPS